MKKERKLTAAEQKRKELFDAKVQELTGQGYEKKDLTINVVTANVMAVVIMLPILVLFYWMYFTINQQGIINIGPEKGIIFLVAIVALLVVHEGIHGITWAIFAKEHFQAIEFGVIWNMLTPYCTCKEVLTKGQYILGGMMPTIVVGFLPAIISITCNYPILFLVSLFMIIGGGGDALIILKLLFHKENGKDSIYMDHPYECGVVVFERTT